MTISMFQRYIIIVFITLSGNAMAQTSSGNQVRLDYNHKKFIKPNLSLGGDAGFRTDISDGDQYAAYVRPRVTYRVNQTFAFLGGLALFHNWNSASINTTEFRIEQQVTAIWSNFKKFHFENRLRIDERYFHYQKSTEVDITDKWSARLRYRLMVKTDYFNISENFGNLYVLLAAETFLPFESTKSDSFLIQERLILGFGQLLSKGRRYEVDFMWQGPVKANPDDSKINLLIIRLRFYVQRNKFK